MNFLIILRVALRSLRRTLLRSSLTALGIIIGVAAVIALLSIGNGARARVEEQMRGMDRNQVILGARMPRVPGRGDDSRKPPPPGKGLNFADYAAIKDFFENQAVVSLDMYVAGGGRNPVLRANGRSSAALVRGSDAILEQSPQLILHQGSLLTAAHVDAAASVCLITQTIAENLFPGKDAINQILLIEKVPFRVVGILEDQQPTEAMTDGQLFQDIRTYVPYTSVLRRLNRDAGSRMMIVVKPRDPAQLAHVQLRLSDLMESRRGNRKVDFITGNLAQVIKAQQQNSQTMSLLLASIGGISLIVGGVGVMNIMLVSVTERTREIGIRLAIGTRDRDILRQFLIEAVILSVLGGVVGIVLGVVGAKLIAVFGELKTAITLSSVLGAFFCSAAIGIFFGWYPARQAARLDPIEALRAE